MKGLKLSTVFTDEERVGGGRGVRNALNLPSPHAAAAAKR